MDCASSFNEYMSLTFFGYDMTTNIYAIAASLMTSEITSVIVGLVGMLLLKKVASIGRPDSWCSQKTCLRGLYAASGSRHRLADKCIG